MEARAGRAVVAVLFLATGFAALLTQVTWQRVIALHSGVDLSSSIIVVAAFLAGLGIGSLLGGVIADRLDAVTALWALALSYLLVALYCLVSTWLLYDLYRSVGSGLELAPLRFGFNALLLLVPTVLQGLSLPLIARVVVRDSADAGPVVARFSAANTIGAAIGAAVGGWVLLGLYGFPVSTQIAAGIYLCCSALFASLAIGSSLPLGRVRSLGGSLASAGLAGVVAIGFFRLGGDVSQLQGIQIPLAACAGGAMFILATIATQWDHWRVVRPAARVMGGQVDERSEDRRGVGIWFAVYGVTGGVALGFELVFFRVVDGIMRSNSYTFAHVLSLYLGLLAVGAAIGSLVVSRVRDRRRGFLWMQFGVGASALLMAIIVFEVLPRSLLEGQASAWFNSGGFAGGFSEGTTSERLIFGLGLPLVLMALPVVLMGASFPFVQGLVTRDMASLGTQTGRLTAVNLVGNVLGAAITGFVLIEVLGSAGTYRVLFVPLAIAGGVAASLAARPRTRWIQGGFVVAISLALLAALPSNNGLWATLHGTTPSSIIVAEDRSCASALELYGEGGEQLTINGAAQNSHPFDNFHVLIGLLPALVHPDPERGLAIGLGIGSTSDAMLVSDRVDQVTSVELCGGNYELVDAMAERGSEDFVRLRDDPRHEQIVGDGRRHLLVTDREYDLIIPDTVRPNSAGSGNLFSREFQELVDGRLSDDGITAGWVPTYRALNAVSVTFPYVVEIPVPEYNDSRLYLASRSPMELDVDVLLERFDALPDGLLAPEQRASLRMFLETMDPTCVNDGSVAARPPAEAENRDLHPRDEYFLTNGGIAEEQVSRTCGG